MWWGILVSVLTFLSFVLTEHFGVAPLIIGAFLLEIETVKSRRFNGGVPIMLAAILGGLFLIYNDIGPLKIDVILSIGLYLIVRHKGYSWFVGNKVNDYVYLLFAISVPVFLTFVTLLVNIEWSLVMFTSLYLVFLRISDHVIERKLPLLLFVGTQSIALNIFQSVIHINNNLIILFIVALIIWSIAKWSQGGQYNVSTICRRTLYRESSKGIYQGLS